MSEAAPAPNEESVSHSAAATAVALGVPCGSVHAEGRHPSASSPAAAVLDVRSTDEDRLLGSESAAAPSPDANTPRRYLLIGLLLGLAAGVLAVGLLTGTRLQQLLHGGFGDARLAWNASPSSAAAAAASAAGAAAAAAIGVASSASRDSGSGRPSEAPTLLCVTYYGPNNQLCDFLRCAQLARATGAVLVLPPLFAHYTDDRPSLKQTPAAFEEYYDVGSLQHYTPVVTLADYKDMQRARIDADAVAAASSSSSSSSPRLAVDCHFVESWLWSRRSSGYVDRFRTGLQFNAPDGRNLFDYVAPPQNGTSEWPILLEDVSKRAEVVAARLRQLFQQRRCQHVFLNMKHVPIVDIFKEPFIGNGSGNSNSSGSSLLPDALQLPQPPLSVFAHLQRAPLLRSLVRAYLATLAAPTLVAHLRRGDSQPFELDQYAAQVAQLLKMLQQPPAQLPPNSGAAHATQANLSGVAGPIRSVYLMTNRLTCRDLYYLQGQLGSSLPIMYSVPVTTKTERAKTETNSSWTSPFGSEEDCASTLFTGHERSSSSSSSSSSSNVRLVSASPLLRLAAGAQLPLLNSYTLSVLEQEVATQAAVFIGVRVSTFSQTIVRQRQWQHIGPSFAYNTEGGPPIDFVFHP